MNDFELSVIVPVYNHTEYAASCLESVIVQLNPKAELVVIDDGSDCKTQEMLRCYENVTDNISVFYKQHKGASEARNAGIKEARGEYICFLDCDDRMREDSIAVALDILKSKADLYIFGLTHVDLTGNAVSEEHWLLENKYYPSVSDFADDYIRKRSLLIYSPCNKLYKRSRLLEKGILFQPGMQFGEDRLFNFTYLSNIKDVVTSEHELYCYIKRSGESLSHRYIPGYFELVTALNREKTDTFIQLSKGTSPEEKKSFIGDIFIDCVDHALERFDEYPEERSESLAAIKRAVLRLPGSLTQTDLDRWLQNGLDGQYIRRDIKHMYVSEYLKEHFIDGGKE